MNNQINFLLQQAINSFHQGNISQTKLLLNNVLKIQPKNFHALHIMAVTLGIENKHSEALNLLLRAVKINPSDSYVNFNLAKALSEIGNDLDSIKYHQAATRIAPKHSEAWLNFGKSLFHEL
jgi:predicted Zn-dependent protease